MTLGEKIREARKNRGLSQEQLADKMAVSRSAVAKWETDKGLPDVGNLKVLARLLNVSVDQLLDEEAEGKGVTREPIHLAAYGYGCSRVKKDRLVREKYPDAAICPLLGRQELVDLRSVSDPGGDCHTNPVDRMRNSHKAFYLVEKDDRQFLVTVTEQFVETRLLEDPVQGSGFRLEGWSFVKCNYGLSE